MLGTMAHLRPGDPAPDFRRTTPDGTVSLGDYRGRWLVLYFYPRSFTPGCTTEACEFRDRMEDLDAAVLGVSDDPPEEQTRFRDAYELPFPILSDEDHALAEAYGAWGPKEVDGREVQAVRRSTFLVDSEGRIADAMVDVRSSGHVEAVNARLAELRA